jgi:CPA2 family monovalent cation:H+ antiporter-2
VDLVTDFTLILIAALAGAFLAQRVGQPLIVGYILAGVVVGPFTGGLTVVNIHDIEQLAEIGVALLLFSLGLELSFRELAPVRAVAVGGTAIQIVLTIGLGLGLGLALGWSWQHGLWFGALISLSSTMVVLKTIQAQGRLGTLSSRVMLGILVVQDLAVVPLMIVLPELSKRAGGMTRVVVATVRALVLLGVIVFVSTRVVPRLMATVARWNSRELFLLSTTAMALGIGYATWSFGLSLALGAFIAGLVINESEYAHQALSDVLPLRDVFGMLFFCVGRDAARPGCGLAASRHAVQRRGRGGGREGRYSRRHRPCVRLSKRRAAGGRSHAVSSRRVCVRAGASRTSERGDHHRLVCARAEYGGGDDGADAGCVGPDITRV